MVAVRASKEGTAGDIFRRFHCALVKIVKVRERTAVTGWSPVGVTGVLMNINGMDNIGAIF